jgi:hypothetical protein
MKGTLNVTLGKHSPLNVLNDSGSFKKVNFQPCVIYHWGKQISSKSVSKGLGNDICSDKRVRLGCKHKFVPWPGFEAVI